MAIRPGPRLATSTAKPSPRITPRSRRQTPKSSTKANGATGNNNNTIRSSSRIAALKAEGELTPRSPEVPSPVSGWRVSCCK